MFRQVIEPKHHQDQSTLQAFTSLLTLVEALATISEQGERAAPANEAQTPPITLDAAGKSFAEIAKQVLDCKYVGVFALDPPDERQRILGTSGLSPSKEQILRRDTEQVPLADYIGKQAIERLHQDRVVLLDLKLQPFLTTRSIHGARYRLIAPMLHQGNLIGIFTMAKTDEVFKDVKSAYTSQEQALAKGIAKLATQVIERVRLLQERAEARANEQKLQEAARRYEDCLSTASHEMRTPLTTIKGNLQLSQRRISSMLKRGEPPPETVEGLRRVEQPLHEALQNFARLERMIGELLDYSRIQADKFLLRKQTCNLIEIVRNAVEEARNNNEGRTFLLNLPEQEVVPIYADKDRISEVVQNYLTNAHKYSPIKHPITVRVSIEDGRARVEVQDEGVGIPAEEQRHIWERFYRVPGIGVVEQSISDSNLGLGLYLCQEIIDLHHGQIGVKSKPNEGSIFWFTLDIAKED